ncbi:LOW QUALITY PROTEIN: Pro_isomerase domain-containing protein, partial [Cephalotus follicularis]
TDEKDSILGGIPTDLREKGSVLHASLIDGKGGLQALLKSIKDQYPDQVSVGLASSLDTVSELELLQASGLSFLLPEQYLKYPRSVFFENSGTVEFIFEKGDGSTFSPAAGGKPRETSSIQVINGAYNGAKLRCINQVVLADCGIDKNSRYTVPLEIMPSGQFEPLYKTTLSVQDGELPVLPLSIYGAVAMAHSEVSEEYSSPSQFFFYLYDKRSGLGGISFDEGQFSVFGYTIVGREILPELKTDDVIPSAKLVDGQDRLVLPVSVD